MRPGIHRLSFLSATALILIAGQAGAQTKPADPGLLTLDRLFGSREFASERFGPARWMKDGDSFTTLEPSAEVADARDLVLYTAASGARRVLVSAAKLDAREGLPPPVDRRLRLVGRRHGPARLHQHAQGLAPEHARRLLDVPTCGRPAPQAGRGFEPSTLMFAKFSPDGRLVAYVMQHNLYVEHLRPAPSAR